MKITRRIGGLKSFTGSKRIQRLKRSSSQHTTQAPTDWTQVCAQAFIQPAHSTNPD